MRGRRVGPRSVGETRRRCYKGMDVSETELSGLNAGYVAQLLEDYLEAPASVPAEWRSLFESGAFAPPDALPGQRPGFPSRRLGARLPRPGGA